MRDFAEIFSVRPKEPQNFLPTRFVGLATLLNSGHTGEPVGTKHNRFQSKKLLLVIIELAPLSISLPHSSSLTPSDFLVLVISCSVLLFLALSCPILLYTVLSCILLVSLGLSCYLLPFLLLILIFLFCFPSHSCL